MNEKQAAIDVDSGINQPDLEPKPVIWDRKSWRMDMADYVLPEGEEDCAEFGELLRMGLLSCSIRGGDKIDPRGAVAMSYWCTRLGEMVLSAALANKLDYRALKELKNE